MRTIFTPSPAAHAKEPLSALRRRPEDIQSGLLRRLFEGRLSRRDILAFSFQAGAMAMWGPLARAASRFDLRGDDRHAAITIEGIPAFEIHTDRFDGAPLLHSKKTDHNFSIRLTNGFVPGTRVPADFELSGERAGEGWSGRVTWPSFKFDSCFSLEPWLLGSPVARSDVSLQPLFAHWTSAGFEGCAQSEGILYPSWILSIGQASSKRLMTLGGSLEIEHLQLELLAAGTQPIELSPRGGGPITRLWAQGSIVKPLRVTTRAGDAIFDSGPADGMVEMHRDQEGTMRDATALESPTSRQIAGRIYPPVPPDASDDGVLASRIRVAVADGTANCEAHLAKTSCWYQRGILNFEVTAFDPVFKPCPDPASGGSSGHFCVTRVLVPVPGVDNAVFMRRGCALAADGRSIDVSGVRHSEAIDDMAWLRKKPIQIPLDEFDLHLSRGSNLLSASIAFKDIDLQIESGGAGLQGHPENPTLEFNLGSQHVYEEAIYLTELPGESGALPPQQLRRARARFAGPSWITFRFNRDRRGKYGMALSANDLFDWGKEYEKGYPRFTLQCHPLAVPATVDRDRQLALQNEPNLPPQRLSGPANANNGKLASLIQAPYRLGLSPVERQSWRMRGLAGTASEKLSELWSVRTERTQLRAVWSPDYRFGNFWGTGVVHDNKPFRASLDVRDRHELVALTARFGEPALWGSAQVIPDWRTGATADTGIFVPQPVRADVVLLSSFGATLRIHGKWAPPAAPMGYPGGGALAVSLWDQASQLGRDTKVVVEYKGFMFPLGFPATLIKETERRLVYERSIGVVARLVQRYYIRITPFSRQLPALEQPFDSRGWPFGNITMSAFVSPDLEPPEKSEFLPGRNQSAFWPRIAENHLWVDFPFRDTTTGVESSAPMLFVDNELAHQPGDLLKVVTHYRNELEAARFKNGPAVLSGSQSILMDPDPGIPRRYVARVASGTICFAPTDKPKKTSFKVSHFLLDVDIPRPVSGQVVVTPKSQTTGTYDIGYIAPQSPEERVTPAPLGETPPPEEIDAVPGADLTHSLQFTPAFETQNQPPFYPHLRQGLVEPAQIAVLTGGTRQPALIEIDNGYLRSGFDEKNPGKVYLRFVDSNARLPFSENTTTCGGFANTSTIFNAASEIRGPIGGSLPPLPQPRGYRYEPPNRALSRFSASGQNSATDDPVGKARAGGADPREFFGNSLGDAKLCGVVSFADIIDAVLKVTGARAPQIVQQLEHQLGAAVVKPIARDLQPQVQDLAEALGGVPYLQGPVQNVADLLLRAQIATDTELLSLGTDLVTAVKDLRDHLHAAIEDPRTLLPPDALKIIDTFLKIRTALQQLEDPKKRKEIVDTFLADLTQVVRAQAMAEIEKALAAYPELAIFLQRLRDIQGTVDDLRRDLAEAPQVMLRSLPKRLLAILDSTIGARAWSVWLDDQLALLQQEAVGYASSLLSALNAAAPTVISASLELKDKTNAFKVYLDTHPGPNNAANDQINRAFLEVSDLTLAAVNHAIELEEALKIIKVEKFAQGDRAPVAKLFQCLRIVFDCVAKVPRLASLQQRLSGIGITLDGNVVAAYSNWVAAVLGDIDPRSEARLLTALKAIQAAIQAALMRASAVEAEALDELAKRVSTAVDTVDKSVQEVRRAIAAQALPELQRLEFAAVSEAITIVDAALDADANLRNTVRRAQLVGRETIVRILVGACGQLDNLIGALKQLVGQAQLVAPNSPEGEMAKRWLSPSLRGRLQAVYDDLQSLPGPPTDESHIRTYLAGVGQFADDAAKLVVELGEIATSLDITKLVNISALLDEAIEKFGVPTSITTSYDWETEVNEYPGGAGAVFIPKDKRQLKIHSEAKINVLHGGQTSAYVQADLSEFDIKLLGSTEFLTISFKPLSFTAGTGRSSVLTADVKTVNFGGELTFIKTLQTLLQEKTGVLVTPWTEGPGVVVGYQFNRDRVGCAAFVLQNIGFSIAAILPFNSERARFRFGFSSPEKPFLLSAGIYGGGGFVAIQSRADAIEYLEASFEYGLVTAFEFGPASGSGRITAGVYIRLGDRAAKIAGFFNASGNADIAGLISVSANFRVIIWYELNTGCVAGRATFSIDFSIGFIDFSFDVGVGYSRQGDGGGGGKSGGASQRELSLVHADSPAERDDLAKLKQRIAESLPRDNPNGHDPDISAEMLKPALWNQYWSAFEESINECA